MVSLTKSGNDAFASPLGRSKINEENLVMSVIDGVGQSLATLYQVAWRKLAFKDAVLKMIAKSLHYFEDFAKSFVVRDVIGHNKRSTHSISPTNLRLLHCA